MVGFVLATLGCGVLLARVLGRRNAFGLLAGGSVAVCGASAALAITSTLPPRPDRDEDTLFVVVGVTPLSTIAMLAYPVLFEMMGPRVPALLCPLGVDKAYNRTDIEFGRIRCGPFRAV